MISEPKAIGRYLLILLLFCTSSVAFFFDSPFKSSGRNSELPTPTEPADKLEAAKLNAQLPVVNELPLSVQNELEYLREESDLARQQIAVLTERVNTLTKQLDTVSEESFTSLDDQRNPDGEVGSGAMGTAAGQGFNFSNRFDQVDEDKNRQALLDSGVDESQIEAIKRQQDEQALSRLELLDLASREGWSESPRLEEELNALNDSALNLQDELGEQAYDQYLYNLGQPNRILVQSIISGSNADISGVEVGDIVERYADEAVFDMRSLREATRGGVRGESVALQVLRNQQSLSLNVVRGPLGVTLSTVRVAPSY